MVIVTITSILIWGTIIQNVQRATLDTCPQGAGVRLYLKDAYRRRHSQTLGIKLGTFWPLH